jgi:hypothetical protein
MRKLFSRVTTDQPPRFVFDDAGVTRHLGRGKTESARFEELTEVAVYTTADGPWAEDVFYVLSCGDHGCVVPETFANPAFVNRLMELPGFDHETFIEAMGSTDERMFSCWRSST